MTAALVRFKERALELADRAPEPDDFTSGLRGPEVAARIGVWLGVCFGIAFLTGVISHEAHLTHPIIDFPTRPVWGYRVSQGLHVIAGTAAIPLLLVKLWTVFPKLFERPPRRVRELVLHGLERISIAVLVAASVFQLGTGLLNTTQWYPWGFSFRVTHEALGWVAIGALLVHIAVKLPVIRSALASTLEEPSGEDAPPISRRGLVRSAVAAAGVAVVATAGATVTPLRRFSVLGVRSGDGPGGIPINKSARAADVVAAALDPGFRLVVAASGTERAFAFDDLLALPQHTATLPIACVEGWSASGTWTGVRVRDLLTAVGAEPGHDVRFESLQSRGPYRATVLPAQFADDELSLLALRLNDEPLALDHGYPCRLIAPNRPGVLQTKWVARMEVLGA